MIIFLWALNFVISWFNAWGCGKTWNETRASGGLPHLLNWAGAVMSASGFTWCYLVIFGAISTQIPFEQDDGTYATLLTPEGAQAFADLGYTLIILPILGSGLVITLQSWAAFWRRRTFGSGAVAGYNTFAQVYNTWSAVQHLPGSSKGALDYFTKGEDKGKGLVAALVALAAVGGILTTWAIIRSVAKKEAYNRTLQYGLY